MTEGGVWPRKKRTAHEAIATDRNAILTCRSWAITHESRSLDTGAWQSQSSDQRFGCGKEELQMKKRT